MRASRTKRSSVEAPGRDGLLEGHDALEVQVLRAEDAAVATLGDDAIEQVALAGGHGQRARAQSGAAPRVSGGVDGAGELVRGRPARGTLQRGALQILKRGALGGFFHPARSVDREPCLRHGPPVPRVW